MPSGIFGDHRPSVSVIVHADGDMALRMGVVTQTKRIRANDDWRLWHFRALFDMGIPSSAETPEPYLVHIFLQHGPRHDYGHPGNCR